MTTTKTYSIEIAIDNPDAENFCNWLNGNGYNACVGTSTGNFIDGVNTSSDDGLDEFMNSLWVEYCNS